MEKITEYEIVDSITGESTSYVQIEHLDGSKTTMFKWQYEERLAAQEKQSETL